MRIAITGHRDLTKQDFRTIQDRVQRFVEEGVTEVITGGAVGADIHVLRCLYACRGSAAIQLIIVVPCCVDDQPYAVRPDIRQMSDQVIELGVPITAKDKYQAYHVRNRCMVDRLTDEDDKLVAFFNGDERSGTWSTMHYARKQGKTVEVVGLEPVNQS